MSTDVVNLADVLLDHLQETAYTHS